jgi:hypothetical protein
VVARNESLRASDADREQIVDRLRNAAAEGRIAAHELEHRVGTALSARTYRELDATVADLPALRSQPRFAAISSLRAHPILLVASIPIVLVAVVLITIASLAIGATLFMLGRRRMMYFGAGGCAFRHGLPHGRSRRSVAGR